jgi:hypothetical protein
VSCSSSVEVVARGDVEQLLIVDRQGARSLEALLAAVVGPGERLDGGVFQAARVELENAGHLRCFPRRGEVLREGIQLVATVRELVAEIALDALRQRAELLVGEVDQLEIRARPEAEQGEQHQAERRARRDGERVAEAQALPHAKQAQLEERRDRESACGVSAAPRQLKAAPLRSGNASRAGS